MKKGGAAPKTAPVAWVFIDRHRHNGYTIRWRRGETKAYVLAGNRIGNHSDTDIVDTIPVLPAGWTDLAEVRGVGMRWIRGQGA